MPKPCASWCSAYVTGLCCKAPKSPKTMKAPKRKGFGARVIMRRPFQAACADFVYSMVRILLKGKITQRTCPMIMSRVRAAGVK